MNSMHTYKGNTQWWNIMCVKTPAHVVFHVKPTHRSHCRVTCAAASRCAYKSFFSTSSINRASFCGKKSHFSFTFILPCLIYGQCEAYLLFILKTWLLKWSEFTILTQTFIWHMILRLDTTSNYQKNFSQMCCKDTAWDNYSSNYWIIWIIN